MKAYRIYHKNHARYMYSNANKDGIYLSLSSARKALSQYKRYFRRSVLVIIEYELTNEKEIN